MVKRDEPEIQKLVGKATLGDRDAFSELVRKLMPTVTATIYRMTGDRQISLDLAQDTFVTVWESLSSFRGTGRFAGWLTTIASNKTLNYIKRFSRETSIDDHEQLIDLSSTPDRQLAKQELAQEIADFIITLPPQQKLIFELRFYQEMTFDEIAKTTGRAVGTVKTGYREAVKKLKVVAVEKGWNDGLQ